MADGLQPLKLTVNFMGWNLHLGWQDPDKCSQVSLINHVLLSALEQWYMIYLFCSYIAYVEN